MVQRGMLLKRLSFIIFCGEFDQYHQYLPDIQERLAESIRQLQVWKSFYVSHCGFHIFFVQISGYLYIKSKNTWQILVIRKGKGCKVPRDQVKLGWCANGSNSC